MNLKKIILIFICIIASYSCADYRTNEANQKKEKYYYSSSGFALIYDEELFLQNIINKKINNEDIRVMHSQLKTNPPLKIINPVNSKVIETKIYKKAKYPEIFNIVISRKIAAILELNANNPYVEVIEVKENKIFIAKKTNTFDEEKKVAENAPVDEITMDDLFKGEVDIEKEISKEVNFILVINDFYFEDSANNLKTELVEKTKMNNISIEKINNKKYRLFVGPF